MTYPEALDYIAGLEPRGWRLGLDRMQEFVRRAGLGAAVDGSERDYLHVAGTNGKGSTTAYLQSLLVESGISTGAFFSPFVVDPRERVQIGRELISKEDLAEGTAKLREVTEAMEGTEFEGVTEFEFKTALGFWLWHKKDVKAVALETGLGGRLDATNVVTPKVSVIVSIGLDHQQILGGTVEEIAVEKAGIIKPGKPVVIGRMEPSPLGVIERIAAERECEVWKFGSEVFWDEAAGTVVTPLGTASGLKPNLKGVWQGHNLALAVAAAQLAGLDLSADMIGAAAERAKIPGRFEEIEWHGSSFILDGAHNVDSSIALAATLNQHYPGQRFSLLTNMLSGHEPEAFFGPLQGLIEAAYVVPIDFHRSRDPQETRLAIEAIGIKASAFSAIKDGIDAARRADLPILVTGSFYLVGDVLRLLNAS